MKLLLIRHGRTIHNEKGIIQGQFNSELSEEGINKTKEFRKTFNRHYDYCYASPLTRTKLTAEIITGSKNIIYDNRLMEASFGEMENTPVTEEKLINYITGKNIPKGAETREDVVRRVRSFLADLKNKYKDTDTILIITHGGVIRAIQEMYNDKSNEIKNLELFELDI